MFKKLSKSEYKYRLRIINTYHLKKEQQRVIDKQAEYSYKEMFNKPSNLMELLFNYSAIESFKRLSYSVQNATTAFKNLMEAIKNYV